MFAVQCLKVLFLFGSFYLLKEILQVKLKLERFFNKHDKFQNIMLIISGIYMSLSMVQILPYSNKVFWLYYENKAQENCDFQYCVLQDPKFPIHYLIPCLSFGFLMLIEKIIGYDYEVQQDNSIEDYIQMYEMEELNSGETHGNMLIQNSQCIQTHSHESNLKDHLVVQQENENEIDNYIGNYKVNNFILINFNIFLVGFSLGFAQLMDHYLYQLIPTLLYVFLYAYNIAYCLEEIKEFKQIERNTIISLYSSLFCSGLAFGLVLSFFESQLFISYVQAFNSGILLYVSTMKILEKYYDTLGNKFLYYLSFSIGFLGISFLLY